ncbi:MAG TPA: hypothetical protein VFG87_23385 [Amycolatopsis sp.]|nr:hypothetical protein [Amycolatopsis sp.]
MNTFLLGAVVGYVLGARAGRARYEQIVRTYRKVIDHPAVQGAAGVVRAKVGEKVGKRVPFVHPYNGHRVSEPTASEA